MSQEKNTTKSPASSKDTGATTGADQYGALESYKRIFRYGSSTEFAMQGVGVVCALASGVGMAMVNLVFGQFITVMTDFSTGKSSTADFRRDSARLALYFFIIGVGRFTVSYAYSTLFTIAAYRVTRNIRYLYLKAGLSQEIAYFDAGTGGSIAMQATSNGKLVQAGIAEKAGMICQGLSTFIAAFVLAFVTQWKLTLICCSIVVATLLVMGASFALEAVIETRTLQVRAQAGAFAESILSSARTVQAFGLQERLVRDYDKFLADAHTLGKKKNLLYGCMFSAEYFVMFAGMGLCFWQAIGMLARGEVEKPGDVFIVLMSVIIASASLTSLMPYLIDLSRAASAASEIWCLIDRISAIDPFDDSGHQPADLTGDIELRHVNFSYPMRPSVKVLDNFSLQIPAGKVTALVGSSGSGKSTIIGLLERWYSPDSGEILLDEQPIEKLNLAWLRKHVRLVQQEPVLFSGTVFDNIANGLVGTSWENDDHPSKLARVQEAAKTAFAHDFISALPLGYDTVIGERGGLLSGGQKQRVAIARSIVSQPRVLLLDEATSALDPHAEGVVQRALDNASKGRTTITVAHKLATIRAADNIVVMKNGAIMEQGTHHSLIAAKGVYTALVKAQNLTVEASPDAQAALSDDEADEETSKEYPRSLDLATKYSTTTKARVDANIGRDDYDNWKRIGLLQTMYKLVISSPELKWTYLVLFFSCLASAAANPGQAILMARFIDIFKYTGSEMEQRGSFFALMFLAIACGALIVYFVTGWASNMVAQSINHKYRKQIVNDMLRQDLQFFDRPENTTGALTSRADSYPYAIFELMGFNVALILTSVMAVLSCSALALAHSWKLGLVIILGGLPPLLFSGYARIRLEAAMDVKTSKRFSASASIASEAINAIRTVSSLEIESSCLDRYITELEHATSDSIRPVFFIMISFAFAQSVEYFFQALGFWYGCRLVSTGELSMVNFFIAFLGVFFSGQQAAILFGFTSSMTKATNAANYIFWLEQLQPLITETQENHDVGPDGFKSLELDKIQFSYPLRPDARILRGVDLEVKGGQFVAFVGASGCGKSTMIAMLERFYDPVKGRIVVDGRAVNEMNPWAYRRDIALVQQEPKLYPGTIRENISHGIFQEEGDAGTYSPSLSDEAIIEACRAANAWDFISSLPEGLNTPCGTNGLQLSGGQRQRIAIARALIRKPKLLLLDEATSALDTQSERVVQDALNQAAASGKMITVAVAHRLSTIRHAEVICVFQDGRIAAAGTHKDLLRRCEAYAKMCAAQSLDE